DSLRPRRDAERHVNWGATCVTATACGCHECDAWNLLTLAKGFIGSELMQHWAAAPTRAASRYSGLTKRHLQSSNGLSHSQHHRPDLSQPLHSPASATRQLEPPAAAGFSVLSELRIPSEA